MKINCSSYEDFIENIKGNTIYGDKIHCSRDITILDDYSGVCEINMHLSCVLCYADGAESLLQCFFSCGRDRPGEETFDGTKLFEVYKAQLRSFCNHKEFSLLPGVLDI